MAAVKEIVSCSGPPDENLADFLDFVLNPGIKQLRAYQKGPKDFLLWLEEFRVQYPQLPPMFAFLIVILTAVQEYLDAREEKKPTAAKTMELLEITKRSNIF